MSTGERLRRIEDNPTGADRDDVLWLLDLVAKLGGERERGIREAAGLIRGSMQREVTTRFLVGKREQAARSMNAKLLSVVANLVDKYATDAAAGKV